MKEFHEYEVDVADFPALHVPDENMTNSGKRPESGDGDCNS